MFHCSDSSHAYRKTWREHRYIPWTRCATRNCAWIAAFCEIASLWQPRVKILAHRIQTHRTNVNSISQTLRAPATASTTNDLNKKTNVVAVSGRKRFLLRKFWWKRLSARQLAPVSIDSFSCVCDYLSVFVLELFLASSKKSVRGRPKSRFYSAVVPAGAAHARASSKGARCVRESQ